MDGRVNLVVKEWMNVLAAAASAIIYLLAYTLACCIYSSCHQALSQGRRAAAIESGVVKTEGKEMNGRKMKEAGLKDHPNDG